MRVLLVTWDGGGNLPPERALVRALIARGHGVRALAPNTLRAPLEDHPGLGRAVALVEAM